MTRGGRDDERDMRGIDEPEILRNRISTIRSTETRRPLNTRSVLMLLGLIAVLAAILVIIIRYTHTRPELFTPSAGEKNVQTGPQDTALPLDATGKKTAPESENPRINRGREYFEKGYHTDAITEFNEVVESDAPDRDKAVALTYLGMISHQRGNPEAAVGFYTRALAYNGDLPETRFQLARAYRALGKTDLALEEIRRGMALVPGNSDARLMLGNILFESGDYKGAIEQYRAVIEKEPGNALALYNLGSAYQKTGDDFAAVEYLKKAGAADRMGDAGFRAHSRLGVIYTQRAEYNQAVEYLKQAAAIRPGDAAVQYNLGLALLGQGKNDEALAAFRGAEAAGGNDTALLERLGEGYAAAADLERSLAVYQKLLAANSRNVKILARVGELFYKKGELDRAYAAYEKITAISPATEHARVAWVNIGNIHDDAGRHADAVKAYENALVIDPKDADALYNLGIAYKNAGKPERAVEAWNRAASLDRKDPKSRLAMADLYYEKQFYDEAEREYRVILETWPDLQDAHFKIGTIYYRKNNLDYALDAFRRTTDIDPNTDTARRAWINMALLTVQKGGAPETLEQAQEFARKALLIRPGDPEGLMAMGTVYAKLGHHEQAIDTWYQALNTSRDPAISADIYNRIGMSHYTLGQHKKALQAFSRGLEENPSHEQLRMNRKAATQAYERSLGQ